MKRPDSIRPERDVSDSISYETLRKEGLRIIQELAGDRWTDYNEHDPGVTLLEALCYAMTDLAYRTRFSIRDLLVPGPDGKIDGKGQGFFAPEDILASSPLTVMDFRKLLIDRVANLRNVWLEPIAPRNVSEQAPWKHKGVRGLYRLYAQLADYSKGTSELERVQQAVQYHFQQHRNLCEDLEEIVIQQPLEVRIRADVHVAPHTDVEDVLVKIYTTVSDFLSPMVPFYTLEEWTEAGISLEKAYEGPVLRHGFIRDEDLRRPPSEIRPTELVKIITRIPEVISVTGFVLYVDGKEEPDGYTLEQDEVAVLDTSRQQTDLLEFIDSNVTYKADHRKAKQLLHQRRSARQRQFVIEKADRTDGMLENAEYRQVETYFSLQHDLPKTYGIGSFGISREAPPARKAQVKQLKAYLVLFEQTLADYQSNLSHVRELFSIRDAVQGSYFTQLPQDVPELVTVIDPKRAAKIDWLDVKGERVDEEGNTINKKETIETLTSEAHADFARKLEQLNQKHDPFNDRRNKFLNHMLARFNETFYIYLLGKFDPYLDADHFSEQLIHWKTRFLQRYTWVGRDRGKGFSYLDACWGRGSNEAPALGNRSGINVSGLVERVSLLLGIENYGERSLTEVLGQSNVKAIQESRSNIDVSSERIRPSGKREMMRVQRMEFRAIDYNRNVQEGAFTFAFTSPDSMRQLLRFGINAANYQIARNEDFRDPVYEVFFQDPVDQTATRVFTAPGYRDAREAVGKVVKYLRKLSEDSEGMHLVEHLLLKPDPGQAIYTFELLQERGAIRPVFARSPKPQTFQEREQTLEALWKHFNTANKDGSEVQVRALPWEGKFAIGVVEAMDGKESLWAVSSELFDAREKAEEAIPLFRESLELLVHRKASASKFIRLFCTPDEGEPLDESFFTFQASMILPDWPARFQKVDFRRLLERTCIENSPAQVVLHFYWLTYSEMARFEGMYQTWLEIKSSGRDGRTEFQASLALVRYLQQFQT